MDIRAYWREQAWTDKDKNDITLVLKQLQYSRHVMDPGRPRTWWDDDGWKESAAANVGYECQRELGLLTEFDRDCKEASAMFIRAGEVTIQAGKGVELGRGESFLFLWSSPLCPYQSYLYMNGAYGVNGFRRLIQSICFAILQANASLEPKSRT